MKYRLRIILGFTAVLALALVLGMHTSITSPLPDLKNKVSAASIPWTAEYYDAGWGVPAIPWNDYTHVFQFAVAPNSDGSINLLWVGSQSEINSFIASRPAGKKALVVMFGADGTYGPIMASVTSPGKIANFVTNVVNFINSNGYDGVDLDWETNVNTTQLSDLISRLRDAMPSKLITMAAGNWGGLPTVAANSYAKLDQINVMCYDMDFGISYTWHSDALFQNGDASKQTCDGRVRAFTSLGVPNAKIGIGMPFYTRRWTGTTEPLQTGGSSAATVGYGTLVKDAARWQSAYQKWDSTYSADYLSIPGLNEFDSYNGSPQFFSTLVNWVASQGFGGYMTFAEHYEYVAGASGDARFPLSAALAAAVNGGTPPPPPPSTDTTAPSVPTGNSATAASPSAINLSWSASTDSVGVTGYKIFRGGAQIGTSAANSYSDTGLAPSTSYSYTVSAYDAAGNNSSRSASAGATTQAGVVTGGTVALTDSGPIVINNQNNVIIENKHIHGTSGDCVTITNSTNVTVRNSEIGPCGSNGLYISGGSGHKLYDNYIHPEASPGGFGSGNGVYAVGTSALTIQGNVIVWGDNDLLLEDITTATIAGNFIFQARGGNGHRGDPIQVWDLNNSTTNYNANTNLTISNNYALNCSNDGLDPAVCGTLGALRSQYPSNREDMFGIGLSNGVIVQNNFLAGHPNSGSGCSLQSDYATKNFQYLNNRLVETWGGPDFSQTTTGLADGNKILTSAKPPAGNCTDVAVSWNWDSSNGLTCSAITFQNNIGATYIGGAESTPYFSGQCGATTQINNVWGASARATLNADSAFLTPPSIPPQPFSCVASSPFTNNPGARCGGGGITPPSDTIAPTAPTFPTATTISASAINLSWSASTDSVGVTGYKIFRGGAQIGTSAANSYSDTGLAPSTSYSYTVSAYDAAGNNSSRSASAGATTQSVLPVVSNLVGSNIIGSYFTWNTSVPTNGQIFYGLTSAYGSSSALLDNITRTIAHTVTLTNLNPSTLYHFKVVSTDNSGKSVSSPDFTFTTLAQGGRIAYIPTVPGLPITGGTPINSGDALWYTIAILILLGVIGFAVSISRKKPPTDPKA